MLIGSSVNDQMLQTHPTTVHVLISHLALLIFDVLLKSLARKVQNLLVHFVFTLRQGKLVIVQVPNVNEIRITWPW